MSPSSEKTTTPPQESQQPHVKVPLKIEDWLSVLVLAALALITFANVIVRYLSNSSFAWTEEISIFLLIVLTMTAGSTAFVRRQHIRVEAFADNGPPQRQRRLAIISASLVLVFFVLLTLLSGRMAYDEFTWGDTSPAIGIPNWWYTLWMPILSGGISLRVAGMLRRLLRGNA